jgi:hypothetical protein
VTGKIAVQVDGYGLLFPDVCGTTVERIKPRDDRQKKRVAELGGLFKITVPHLYRITAYGYEIQVVRVP